ncbi:MAG: 16S rRNA (cytosine(1402)-N(4))-methyltransferase RsmH [Planctomycetaceae bacterium]
MPVLLREVLRELDLRPGLVVVDGTVGAAGHAHQIHPRIQPGGRLIGLDRDPLMLRHAGARMADTDCELVHSPYSHLRQVLDDRGIGRVDRVLLDLGLSSDQLADRQRGFGYDAGGPLDMRFDTTQGEPAAEWLARVDEAELARALSEYGEVPHAARLAADICQARRTRPPRTTADLLAIVEPTARGGGGRPRTERTGANKSSAPQVFQTLRIVVNRELDHLREFLDETLPACLEPGGRVAIISFHSIEDRMVKQALRPAAGWEPTTRKPVEATPSEVRFNPRSRSARLRVATRVTQLADRT